jgi:hypothetical protein
LLLDKQGMPRSHGLQEHILRDSTIFLYLLALG